MGSLITGRTAPIYDDNDIACEKNDEDIIHPCQFPCHGISLVLSDDDMGTILSDNSSNEAIVKCFDTSEVTNMDQFLMGSNINADLSSWDVSSVTSMRATFNRAPVFDNDISSWDVSSVTEMQGMFYSAFVFNNDISSWDVSSVTVMTGIFKLAPVFNNDISGWDVSSVTSMHSMFHSALAFNNDISSWDVSAVITMESMFDEAEQFEQQMCEWNLEGKDVLNMFTNNQCTEVECVDCPSS